MFDRLDNRYSLTGALIVDRALHVGLGSPLGDVDMPVMRDRSGKPFVPGSSVRGAIRSVVERSLATLAPVRSCVLFDEASSDVCPSVNSEARKRIEKMVEDGESVQARGILFGLVEQPGRLCAT